MRRLIMVAANLEPVWSAARVAAVAASAASVEVALACVAGAPRSDSDRPDVQGGYHFHDAWDAGYRLRDVWDEYRFDRS